MLTESDLAVLRSAVRAAVEGPFFPDWEFHALTGLTREEMREVLGEWPNFSDQSTAELAVHNALVYLIGYPHGNWPAWREFGDAGPEELKAVFSRLKEVERRGVFEAALRGHDPQVRD